MTNFPQNIEYFNRIILELFIRLYDRFPHPLHIDNQTSTDIGFVQFSGDAKDEEILNIGIVADDIMEWLKEEGFIRYDPDPNYRPGTFWKVRLTLKGITILGYVPISLRKTDAKEPLIQKAKQVITSTESLIDKEAIRRVVEEIFKLALYKGES
ncbi:MAG: hypothetical protein MUP22_12945 [Desulfobacterales bacterium]|nr:hypothetical protein [Desulfobacterales bacterium]